METTIKVTEDNLEELSKAVEIIEVMDDGVKFYGSKNGIVVREMFVKWFDHVMIIDGVTYIVNVIHEHKDDVVVVCDETNNTQENIDNNEIIIDVTLPKGMDEVIADTPDAELKEMCDDAMKKAMSFNADDVQKMRKNTDELIKTLTEVQPMSEEVGEAIAILAGENKLKKRGRKGKNADNSN